MSASTLVAAWTKARRAFESAGLDTPIADARLLLQAAAGVDRIDIVTDPHRPLPEGAAARLDAMIARRLAREPVAYITGRQGFWTLDLDVTPAVLIPRPDTEAVVHVALALAKDQPSPRVLDLGVGSGAILLAILAERPDATGLGVDLSPAALEVAAANAARHGLGGRVTFREGHWGEGIEGTFDLIVSNPPYIEAEAIAGLQPEVATHEPRGALDGGPDGLDAYRALAPHVARLLAPGGGFALEFGLGQGPAVADVLAAHGLPVEAFKVDLTGRDRVAFGRKAHAA
ncbi:MAG: peptide chain release factor N(5)-glutamine methyltransferase [Alphaproteobacteria bacterium]|nr:peptide chain release factor N(5)-glutamine methyltransferase [Alphaproteobacteria bacterium]